MRAMAEGVDSGDWDNEDYLATTKTFPKSSAIDLYKQALAHKASLEDRGMRPTKEAEEYYAELEAELTPEEIAAVKSGAYDKPEEPAPAPRPAPPPASQQLAASAAVSDA